MTTDRLTRSGTVLGNDIESFHSTPLPEIAGSTPCRFTVPIHSEATTHRSNLVCVCAFLGSGFDIGRIDSETLTRKSRISSVPTLRYPGCLTKLPDLQSGTW